MLTFATKNYIKTVMSISRHLTDGPMVKISTAKCFRRDIKQTNLHLKCKSVFLRLRKKRGLSGKKSLYYKVYQGFRLNNVERSEMIIFWSLLTTWEVTNIGASLKSNRQIKLILSKSLIHIVKLKVKAKLKRSKFCIFFFLSYSENLFWRDNPIIEIKS